MADGAYRPGLLVEWEPGPEGWRAWGTYLEIGAVAHGQNVRVRTELLEERWVRQTAAVPPESDRSVFREVNATAPGGAHGRTSPPKRQD